MRGLRREIGKESGIKYILIIVFIGICLSLRGSFIGEANANAMMVSNKRLFGLPAKPTYLYILVDESLTANQVDNDGKYRSGITSTILKFATAYGWISGTDFCTFVYQYSTEYEGNLKDKIWPPGDDCPPLMLENNAKYQNLDFALRSLAKELEHSRGYSGAVEDLSNTLETVRKKIDSSDHAGDSMVILVTQGSPIEEGKDANLQQELGEAASEWKKELLVPLGVVLFEDHANLEYLEKRWVDYFFDELTPNEEPQKYLLALLIDMPVPVRDQNIWDWMVGIYRSAKKLGKDADVRVAKISQGNREAELDFNCAPQNFRLIALSAMGEEFILRDENHLPINSTQAPVMNLYRWNVENRENSPQPTTWYFSSSSIVDTEPYFLFSYSCFSTIPLTKPPALDSTPPPIETPPSTGIPIPETSTLTPEARKVGIGGGIALAVIFVLFVLFYKYSHSASPLELLSASLWTLNLCMLLVAGLYLWNRDKVVDIPPNLIANSIAFVLLGGGGGGLLYWLRGRFGNRDGGEISRFSEFLIYSSPFSVALFVTLIIFWVFVL